ncbi:hypothetical protein AB0K00_06335 [Dactylosporangium sp. NPDC049525]|uniref:hypothetical protein n=1 Tax=Dactylosporangium sp. NPDC049525 TaxID=3154730 RepID=UPI00343EDF8D
MIDPGVRRIGLWLATALVLVVAVAAGVFIVGSIAGTWNAQRTAGRLLADPGAITAAQAAALHDRFDPRAGVSNGLLVAVLVAFLLWGLLWEPLRARALDRALTWFRYAVVGLVVLSLVAQRVVYRGEPDLPADLVRQTRDAARLGLALDVLWLPALVALLVGVVSAIRRRPS